MSAPKVPKLETTNRPSALSVQSCTQGSTKVEYYAVLEKVGVHADGWKANQTALGERPHNNLLRRLNDADFKAIAPHLSQDEAQCPDLLC